MAGGYTDKNETIKSDGIYIPYNNSYIPLPPLNPFRVAHTLTGLTACGGTNFTDAATTCSSFNLSSGLWEMSHWFRNRHNGHVAWKTDEG